MRRLLSIAFCLLAAGALRAAAPQEPAHFKGPVEDERLRVLHLLDGCRELKAIEALVGPSESKSVTSMEWPAAGYSLSGSGCTTAGTVYYTRNHFSAASSLVDLDVITNDGGVVLAILITEKSHANG